MSVRLPSNATGFELTSYPHIATMQTMGSICVPSNSPAQLMPSASTEYRERIVDVPEVQIVERVVEIPQRVTKEKVISIPKLETIERRHPILKPYYREKIVEVPQVQYREVIYEKLVEVPDVQTKYVNKEVEVPLRVEIPITQPKKTPIEQEIHRNIPMLVDVRSYQTYDVPKLKPKYKEIQVPIYVPRYIEVPVPAQFAAPQPALATR